MAPVARYGSDGVWRYNGESVSLPDEPNINLVDFFFQGVPGSSQIQHKQALIHSVSGSGITYSALKSLSYSLGSGLTVLGIGHGDVVMLVLRNSIYFPVAFFGVISIGAIITTANPLSTRAELLKQIKDSGSTLVITSRDQVGKFEHAGVRIVVVEEENETEKSDDGLIPFSKVVSAGRDMSMKVSISQTDTAALLYSSGTTGLSKGVILTHRNLIAALKVITNASGKVSSNDVLAVVLPMFHVAGLVYAALATLYNGSTLIVMPNFDMSNVLEAIQKYRITYFPLVPPILIQLAKDPLCDKYDLSSLRFVRCGAAPLGKETTMKFLQRFPNLRLEQAWGMTETTAVGFGCSPDAPFGSAGGLMPNLEAKVIDTATGKSLPVNSIGELLLRGPVVMQGYLNNIKATAETVDKEGWLHTGDLVYFDKDGYVFVVDRVKELIKYKGFQVAPAELEALLLSDPRVLDCAVVSYPDDEAGEIPIAYIVRFPGSLLMEKDVLEFINSKVSPHKKIRRVLFVDKIPKSASGKILRKDLKHGHISKL